MANPESKNLAAIEAAEKELQKVAATGDKAAIAAATAKVEKLRKETRDNL